MSRWRCMAIAITDSIICDAVCFVYVVFEFIHTYSYTCSCVRSWNRIDIEQKLKGIEPPIRHSPIVLWDAMLLASWHCSWGQCTKLVAAASELPLLLPSPGMAHVKLEMHWTTATRQKHYVHHTYTPPHAGLCPEKKTMAGVHLSLMYMQTAPQYSSLYIHHQGGAAGRRCGVYRKCRILTSLHTHQKIIFKTSRKPVQVHRGCILLRNCKFSRLRRWWNR